MPTYYKRGVRGYSIWLHSDGVYQAIHGRRRTNSTPVYTSRDLLRAEEWRSSRLAIWG